jgi:hypothetical protein
VITALLFLIILYVDTLASFFFLIVLAKVFIILVLVVRLQTSLCLEIFLASAVTLSAKPSPSLAHFIEEIVTATRLALSSRLRVIIIIKYLLVLSSLLVQLQVFNYFLVFLLSLNLLQIVFVQLVLKVIDVGELLNIDCVETFKFRLKTLVLLLVFGLNVLNALESLFCTLILLLPTLDFIVKFSFIQPQLLNCIIHLSHLSGLSIDNISNALLNISLFGVRVEVARDRVEELECLISCFPQLALLSKEIEKLCSTLSDLSGECARSLQVV